MSFDPAHLWESMGIVSKVIFFVMIIMGIASLYVGIERLVTLSKARAQSRSLAESLTQHLVKGDVAAALKACQNPEYKFSYLGHLMEAGLRELNGRFDRFILATVGSTAPFVGLVGTIFGIINAFSAMAASGSGGLASVSGGIAEALVATAVGIVVAIIGVWQFNYFTSRIELITNDISVSVEEFVDWCEKQLIARAEGSPDAPTQEVHAK